MGRPFQTCNLKTHMRFVQNFTPPDFQAKTFTPSILPILNGLSDKNTDKLSYPDIQAFLYPKKVVFSGSLSYLSRPLDIRGEVALSFLLVRVSLDLPAIFQLPSTSLVFNREYLQLRFPSLSPGAAVEVVVLVLVACVEVVVGRELPAP